MDKKKKQEAYNKAMREASVVRSPSNILGKRRKKAKVLGEYNQYIY